MNPTDPMTLPIPGAMPFSLRTGWVLKPNRLTDCLEEKERCGQQVLDLTESNPTRASLSYPPDLLDDLGNPENRFYRPLPRGLPSAVETVRDYYRARGMAVPENRIFLSASTSESYTHLFRLLGNPGDIFLTPRPSYPLFEFLAQLECVRLSFYPLAFDGLWHIDFPGLSPCLAPDVRAILLVHPNNPTGSYVKQPERERLQQICREHRLALIVDEVFYDYGLERPADAADFLDGGHGGVLTFVLNGLSKAAALPQMKLAWTVVEGPEDVCREALGRMEMIHDTFLSVSTPVQHSASRFLQAGESMRRQILSRLRQNLAFLSEALRGTACTRLPAEGGWFAAVQVPCVQSEESWVLGLLEEENLLLHPGYFFDFMREAYLVFSLLTPPDIFREGVSRFLRYLQRQLG